MAKIDRIKIAYYGKPIESLTRDELIDALEELGGVIHDCATKRRKCREIIQINEDNRCRGT